METGLQEAGDVQDRQLLAEEHVQRLPQDGSEPQQLRVQQLPTANLDPARTRGSDGLQ